VSRAASPAGVAPEAMNLSHIAGASLASRKNSKHNGSPV